MSERESEVGAEFEFVTEVDVRYVDIDTQHVVNNGVYTQFLTESRVGFLEAITDRRIEEVQDIVVGGWRLISTSHSPARTRSVSPPGVWPSASRVSRWNTRSEAVTMSPRWQRPYS